MKLNTLILPVLAISLISGSAFAMQNLSKQELKQIEQEAIVKYEQERQNKEALAKWEEDRKNNKISDENVGLVFETALFAGCIKLLGFVANQFPQDTTLGMLMKAGQIASACGYYADFNDYNHASKGLMHLCSGLIACMAYQVITK